ncbi:GNAT family N-acetyltransferase [Telmatocola sphagniphila]|uniref:GNAT family N-acetyltransferase n=1 Tax=Telmatocola sphagniphila TaxID=1123043 RepID=A0A8E6B875_9BACT|nr:GNAT family N-acetyltransferase [Telmatocola sphagniphila]QVL32328.1 GNAT family N-acetyltransferase [Telmatocola sphagniphila]
MNATREIYIRWLIRSDLSRVLEIERDCFDNPWDADDFNACLRQRNCIGQVAEIRSVPGGLPDRVLGFMIYELEKETIRVRNFAVDSQARRTGVGTALVGRLFRKLGRFGEVRRSRIAVILRESNLDAQSFYRHFGFKAVKVLRAFYQDTGEDGYELVYRSN